jgi:hypothetical protein
VSRAALACFIAFASCHPGGEYGGSARKGGDVDRGETNGRMFDFVSNKPDGDDWQIRVRGSAMNVNYAREDSADKLGTVNLDDKETAKLWKLIDKLDIAQRKKGKKDEDGGTVTLRLREPGGEDDQHDIYTVYIPRDDANNDDDIMGLAQYLQKLVAKYFKEKPNF